MIAVGVMVASICMVSISILVVGIAAGPASAHDGHDGHDWGGSGSAPSCFVPPPSRPSWCGSGSTGWHGHGPTTTTTPTTVGPAVVPVPTTAPTTTPTTTAPVPPTAAAPPVATLADTSSAATPRSALAPTRATPPENELVAAAPVLEAAAVPSAAPPDRPTVAPGAFPFPTEPGGGSVPLGVAVGIGIAGLVTGMLVGFGALGRSHRVIRGG
jgi:hypothetical protein